MKNVKPKILTILIGVVCVFAILEIFLRGIGFLYNYYYQEKKETSSHKNTYKILCIGDSYTAGSGAPPGKSYPAQLQELLNKNNSKKNFEVINAGVGAYNTRMILDNLENQLIQSQPDLVIILAGGANFWNYWGYSEYLHKNKLFSKLEKFLYRIRIFKFCKLLSRGLREKLLILRVKKRSICNNFDNICLKKGSFYFDHGELEKAIGIWKKGLRNNPQNWQLCLSIGIAYLQIGEFSKAEKWLKETLRINPYYWETYAHWSVLCLIYLENLGNKEKFNECVKYLDRYKKIFPEVEDFIRMLRQKSEETQAISRWIKDDIKEMVQLCQKYNTQILLLTYPIESEEYHICNNIIKSIAKKYGIKLLNTASIFKNLNNEGFDVKTYFTIDQHCNEKGYRIIAEQICKIVLEEPQS